MKMAKFWWPVAALMLCGNALAQTAGYPERPIRMVVPYPPGGPSDTTARIIGDKLSTALKQTVVIDNRPGGNTLIGAAEFIKAKPDGYTIILCGETTMVLNQFLYTSLPYDPHEFEPVSKLATVPNILVTNANGPKTLKALIEQARANPGKLTFGYGAVVTQLGGLLLNNTFNIKLQEVPYKGGALVLQGLLSGDVTVTVDGSAANLPQIEAGKLFAIANMSSLRVPTMPNLPRVADMPGAAGFESSGWNAIYAPKGTPPAIIAQLNRELVRILAMQDVKDKLAVNGVVVDPATPSELRAFVASEEKVWKPIMEKSGIPKIQ